MIGNLGQLGPPGPPCPRCGMCPCRCPYGPRRMRRGWGQTPAEAVAQMDKPLTFWEQIQSASPAIAAVVETTADPYKQTQILQAQLAAARARGASLLTIQKLEGKLVAAQRRLAIKSEGEQSTREWRALGKAGITVGIGAATVISLAIVYFLIRKAA